MDSIFKISKKGNCGITITGLEKDNDEYLNEDSLIISTRMYAYKQSVSVDILKHLDSLENEQLESYKVVLHNIDCIDECDMQMLQDGLYTVIHMILPNEIWLLYVLDTSIKALDAYLGIYYYDQSTQMFMKYQDNQKIEVPIEEILEINPLQDATIRDKTTTIIRNTKNTFQLCHLMLCFYNLCTALLTTLPQRCVEKLDQNLDTLLKNRDVFWMAINVIKYLLQLELYFEAARVLENITLCNSICGDVNITKNSSKCGCIKE